MTMSQSHSEFYIKLTLLNEVSHNNIDGRKISKVIISPHITFPTRFSNKNGTLIDNIFCKLLPCTQEHCSGILIKKLSDHLPCFMLINSQTRKRPRPNDNKKLTQHAILNIQNDLVEKNIYDKLDKSLVADVNQNYNIMHQEIYDTIEKHTLKKTEH